MIGCPLNILSCTRVIPRRPTTHKMKQNPLSILTQYLPLLLALFASNAILASEFLNRIFDEYLFADLLKRCDNHLLVKLAKHLDFDPIEIACASYRHSNGPGTQTFYPVSILVRCLVVKYLYDLSLRELEQRLHSDLLVRWFVGLPAFGDVPTYSTLERFELWVSQHQHRIYHDMVLKQIDEFFPQSRKLSQIGDTYAMIANAAEEELITRLRHTAECLLREAVKSMSMRLTPTVSGFAWHKLFGAPKEKLGCQLNKQERHQRIEVVAGPYGFYTLAVSSNWSGTVTPSKPGHTYDPPSRTYTNVLQNQTEQNYATSVAFRSIGAYDGWVRESSETSGWGDSLSAKATTLRLGDDDSRRQYRSILVFNWWTASPPKLSRFLFSTTPRTTYGPFSPKAVASWYSINLTKYKDTLHEIFQLSKYTQIRLRFKQGDNNDDVANYLSLFSGNAPAADRPQLVVTYYMP